MIKWGLFGAETIEQKKARRHQYKTHSLPTRVLRLEDASKNRPAPWERRRPGMREWRGRRTESSYEGRPHTCQLSGIDTRATVYWWQCASCIANDVDASVS